MKPNLILLGILFFIAFSCQKEEETYTQEQLNGTWEALELTSLGCVQQLEIGLDSLYEIRICDGIPVKIKATDYSFDGRILKYKLLGVQMEFEISELTAEKLALGVHDPMVFKRILD